MATEAGVPMLGRNEVVVRVVEEQIVDRRAIGVICGSFLEWLDKEGFVLDRKPNDVSDFRSYAELAEEYAKGCKGLPG